MKITRSLGKILAYEIQEATIIPSCVCTDFAIVTFSQFSSSIYRQHSRLVRKENMHVTKKPNYLFFCWDTQGRVTAGSRREHIQSNWGIWRSYSEWWCHTTTRGQWQERWWRLGGKGVYRSSVSGIPQPKKREAKHRRRCFLNNTSIQLLS